MNKWCTATFVRVCTRTGITLVYLGLIAILFYAPWLKKIFLHNNRELSVYTFTNNFKPELICAFEQLYKVKVNLKYFDSNEELLAKFQINKGEGYDIVTITDHVVELLRNDGILHKFDRSQLPVFEEIDPKLLGFYFDPANDYSIPLMWFPYGIVYRKDIFKENPATISYGLIFENPQDKRGGVIKPYRICMDDDFRDAIVFASLYLYKDYDPLALERLPAIQDLLVKQKQWVESYVTQDLRYYLLTDLVKVAIAPTVFVRKVIEQSDLFDFKIPEEGGYLAVDNMVIPKKSQNVALAYKFINFILSRDAAFQNSDYYGFNPTNKRAYQFIAKKFFDNPHFFPEGELFEKLYMLRNNVPMREYEELWLAVKSDS